MSFTLKSRKKLFGAEWKKRIAKHTILIHAAMKTHKIDNEIEAAMKLIEECQDIDDTGIFTKWERKPTHQLCCGWDESDPIQR